MFTCLSYFSHATITTTSEVLYVYFFSLTFSSSVVVSTGVMQAICYSRSLAVVSGFLMVANAVIAIGAFLVVVGFIAIVHCHEGLRFF